MVPILKYVMVMTVATAATKVATVAAKAVTTAAVLEVTSDKSQARGPITHAVAAELTKTMEIR